MFLVASWWLPWVRIGLALFGLSPMLRRLIPRNVDPRRTLGAPQLERLGEIVAVASRHSLVDSTCLTRSIVLARILRRRGADCDLKIGVRLHQGKLHAHAWVQCHGVTIADPNDVSSAYAAFANVMPAEVVWDP